MASLGSLVASLELQSASFNRGLDRATQQMRSQTAQMRRANRQLQQSFRGVQTAVGRLRTGISALAAVLAVRQFARFSQDAIRLGDDIAQVSQRLGVTAEQLQILRFAAEQTGTTTRTLDMALQRLGRRLGEARQGTGVLRDTLIKYGIAVQDVEGRTRGTVAVLLDLADVIQNAESQTERLRIAQQAFDSEGVAFLNALTRGRQGLEEFAQQAEETGAILSDEMIRRAQEAQGALGALQFTFRQTFSVGVLETFGANMVDTQDAMERTAEAGRTLGRTVGTVISGLARGAELAARHMRALTAAASAFVTFKLAGVVLGVVRAVIQLGAALRAAAGFQAAMNVFSKGWTGIAQGALAAAAGIAAYRAVTAEGAEASEEMRREAQRLEQQLGDTAGSIAELTDEEKKQREQLAATKQDLQEQNSFLRALRDAHNGVGASIDNVETAQRALTAARQAGLTVAQAEAEGITELVVRNEQLRREIEEIAEAQREAQATAEESQRERERQAEDAARLMQQPFINALENIQRSFADTFERIFSGGIDSFKDLAGEIKRIFVRLAAEMAALMTIRPALGGLASAAGIGGFASPAVAGVGGGGGALSGLLGTTLFGGSVEAGTGFTTGGFTAGNALLAGGLGALGGSTLASVAPGTFGSTGSTVGGSVGGIAGAAIGSVVPVIGTALGGVIGSAFGSVVGGVLGKAFGGEEANRQGGVALRQGRIVGQFGDDASKKTLEAANAVGSQIEALLQGIESATGARFQERLQIAIGERDPSRIRVGAGSIFDPGTLRSAAGDPEAALGVALGEIAANFEELSNLQQRVLQRSVQLRGPDVQAILGDVQFAKAFEDAANQMTAVEREIRAVNDRFDELRQTARDLGLNVRLLNRAERVALRDLIQQRRAALEQQRDALANIRTQARGFFEGLIDPLQQLQRELTAGPLGGASPAAQFAALQEQFEQTAALARGGDLQAIQRLAGAGRAFVEGAGEFGASPAQARIAQEVAGVVGEVVSRIESEQQRVGEPPASARDMRAQTDALIEVEREQIDVVLELVREIRKLRQARQAA